MDKNDPRVSAALMHLDQSAEKPILFSAPMVRAILDRTKTETRRVIKLPTKALSGGRIYEHPVMGGWAPTTIGGGGCFTIGKSGQRVPAPEMVGIWHQTCGVSVATRWQPGDRLWVREAWRAGRGYDGAKIKDMAPGITRVWYNDDSLIDSEACGVWRPSIHMPRWASRITLLVKAVRVERLHDITPAGVLEEGVTACDTADPRDEFASLWNIINGPGSWDANPWVAVVQFERVAQ